MRSSQCLCNSRRAFYTVFVSPYRSAQEPLSGKVSILRLAAAAAPTSSPASASSRPGPGLLCASATQVRSYASNGDGPPPNPPPGPEAQILGRKPGRLAEQLAEDERRTFDRRFTTARDIERSGRDRPPWDHEITDPHIMVIDNGVAEGPLLTKYVLTKLVEGESLRMIQPYKPANPEDARPAATLAVCKIVNKKEEYERMKQVKERKKTAAAAKPKTKELELTWAIGDHDLATKLRQMGGFLAKGMKIELTIGRKKGGKKVEADQAKEVLKKIREEVTESRGREAKAATGEVGATMKLYFEGAKPSS